MTHRQINNRLLRFTGSMELNVKNTKAIFSLSTPLVVISFYRVHFFFYTPAPFLSLSSLLYMCATIDKFDPQFVVLLSKPLRGFCYYYSRVLWCHPNQSSSEHPTITWATAGNNIIRPNVSFRFGIILIGSFHATLTQQWKTKLLSTLTKVDTRNFHWIHISSLSFSLTHHNNINCWLPLNYKIDKSTEDSADDK